MDTNGDGIVDDLLGVKKKRGRKSLGLNNEEMKAHREVLRKIRVAKKREEEKRQTMQKIVNITVNLNKMGFSLEDIAEQFVVDPRFEIKFNENATLLSGAQGGRIRRHRGKKTI